MIDSGYTAMKLVFNKRASQFVEAGIALPIIILGIMLMLRLFTFYLQILCTGIQEHEKALEAMQNFNGMGISVYENAEEVEMLKGGLLGFDLKKCIETKAYLCNEEKLVRANEILH